MKKLFGLLGIFILLATMITAVDMTITPQLVNMDQTDSKDIVVCVSRADGSPYVGLDLDVTKECQDLNGDEACSSAEVGNAVGVFSATVKTSPTDANGCGEVTLATNNAAGGTFAYAVNSYNGKVEVDSETGLAVVPEFATIGAALALAGAGLYIFKKRK